MSEGTRTPYEVLAARLGMACQVLFGTSDVEHGRLRETHKQWEDDRMTHEAIRAENARLRAALRGLLDTGWHRDYGYVDPACDAPNGDECSCGLTNAKNAARAALEADRG